MAINSFNVSYNDFELDQVINPDEFDVNFADIAIRINQIIDVLNQITDGVNGNGADIIHIGDVFPFTSERLQLFLQELVDQLRSNEGESGAHFIGSSNIPGVTGETVHEQLLSLNEMLRAVVERIESEAERLDLRISGTDEGLSLTQFELGQLKERVSDNEGSIESKANQSDVYTKLESDINDSQVEATIRNEFYNKDESDSLLSDKVTVGDNHVGSWQGIDVDDISDVVGVSGVAIQEGKPSNPLEKTLWFQPSTNTYTLFLNGQWRIHGAPTQLVQRVNRVITESDTNNVAVGIENFNPDYDVIMVHANSTYLARGYDYTVNTNGTITKVDGTWDAGTVIDFEAHVSTPISG